MSQILTTLGGTFTSCACGRQQFGGVRDCVFALMSRFVCDRSRFSANGQRVACPDDKEGNDPISSMPTPMSSPSALPTSQTLNSTLGIKTKPVKRVKNGKADLGPMVGWTVAEGPYVGIQGLSNRNGYIEPGPRSTPSSFPPTPSSPFSSTPQLPGVPTPSGSVNSKAWASVVGLYDAPRPVTTSSSSATQFRPDPSSTSSNSVLMSPTPRYQGPIYDRSNLPKISTSLPVPMASPLEPQRHQPHLPSVTNKPPSPHHGMSMSRGIVNGVSAASTCPSPILESAVEESDSYLFIVHQSPVSTSAVSFAKEVLGAPPVASPQESAEVDTLMSEGAGPLPMEQRRLAWVEDNEPIKLPPKMQKRMKSSGGGGPILEAPGTAGASSFDDKVDADATLMPPPFIPDSFDPVTVTSMPVSSPSDLHSCVELPSCSLPLSSSDQLSNLTASRKMTEMPATPNSTLRDTVVVGAPKREPEPEPEQMSTPAFTGRATTPHLAPEPLAASSPAPVPAPAVRMSFFDWKQKRAQEKHGKNRKDAIIVKEEMYECQGLQSPGLDVNVKIEADVDDGCAPLTSSSSEKMGSRTELTQPQFHIDIPTIDVSFTVASGAPMFPAPIQTPPVSRSPHEDSLPRLAFASKPLECGSLWKDPATNPSPPPTLPASSEMDMDDDDVRLDVVRSPTETMRPATRPEQASLSIVLPTPSPDAEDAEDGEIPPSPHDKPLSPPTRLLATPVLPEPRRAPRSMTPLVHLPPPLPPVRRSSPGERYRPGSPPRERRLPHPSRSYRPDPPPPSLNSYRPSSPADSTSSPSDSPRHLSNTWHDEPRAPPSAGRGGDRWYGSSWRVSSSQHHSTSIGGGPRSGGPRDHYRDRDYAPPHGFARGGWDSDRGASGVGRYMDRNRYPRDRDARELIKQRGIEARAREAEVYKGRTVPSNPRGGA
ncbi:hypothetical protein BS47DRAFT_233853 [Hydnum rufescens UP504]|uniref:Uncharacterized protein n=1 Tax=Hydnum rufescens UP504 TaxID=1448309 RepID=A0A9P6AM06_9AGAM|nr:hypothetical protein BS47DRAFT_233853 [Hydnum rufescens UP504]